MRKLTAFLLLLSLTACQEPLLESLPRFMREKDRYARNARKDSPEEEPGDTLQPEEPPVPEYIPSVYATALHFRDSVNWRTDSLGLADILFFKDGVCLLQVPVKTPPDPERHRIREGHLWTDETDGHQTVISCDGKEQFRFDGEEHLQGFLIKDGEVHTLGQRPGRDGFCYRINGKSVFDSPRGSVLGSPSDPDWPDGALSLDGNDIYYCYSLPITLSSRTDREYHVMRGGEAYTTIPAGTSDALYGLRVHKGEVVRAEKRGSSICRVTNQQERALNLYLPALASCQLAPVGDSVTVKGATRTSGTSCLNWYFNPAQNVIQPVATGQSERSLLVFREGHWAFADMSPDGRLLGWLSDLSLPELPDGDFTLAASPGLFVCKGHGALALTNRSGNTHTVLSDLSVTSYTFNGYFTSVRIE